MKGLLAKCVQKAAIGGILYTSVMMTGSAAAASSVVYVRNIQYAGSGCPIGSIASRVSDDLFSVHFLYDSFLAEAGPGVSLRETRKNCQVLLDLAYPNGWQYAIDELEHGGYVSLDRGVSATMQVSYYFQGQSTTGTLSTTFNGPIDRNYVVSDRLSRSEDIWSPCGASRALNINVSARVSNLSNRRASGLITVDSPLDTIGQLRIKWRRCR